jgi:hypothetical protein
LVRNTIFFHYTAASPSYKEKKIEFGTGKNRERTGKPLHQIVLAFSIVFVMSQMCEL